MLFQLFILFVYYIFELVKCKKCIPITEKECFDKHNELRKMIKVVLILDMKLLLINIIKLYVLFVYIRHIKFYFVIINVYIF